MSQPQRFYLCGTKAITSGIASLVRTCSSTKCVAARVARPDLKVLFITGYAENAVLSHGHLDAGMHVLTKPFALEALASRIKDLIAD